jgi:hypothetical protein
MRKISYVSTFGKNLSTNFKNPADFYQRDFLFYLSIVRYTIILYTFYFIPFLSLFFFEFHKFTNCDTLPKFMRHK